MAERFYLTTTLPYVNAEPHLGFALELVQADAVARYRRLLGEEVFLNTGTDEHGLKIYRRALELGREPQAYVDAAAAKFKKLLPVLGIWPEANFIRTTDVHHLAAAAEFWRRCHRRGDIYKKNYAVKYCVGCELEKTESELENGHCSVHPNLALEIIEEENYFFKFSQYQQPLLDFYDKNPDFVLLSSRFNEIKKFVARGLEDFSISRLKSKMPWGVPVPGDNNQVMYVWFDALVSYLAAVGWPSDEAKFQKWWEETGGAIQFAGKDNLRQQAAMWQAMLMSAGLPPSRQIVIHGFINSGGQKMSKSLGNVIDPFALVEEYGTDAVRYFLMRHVHPFEDSDFTMEKFKEAYNANLANGLGNLVNRTLQMSSKYLDKPVDISDVRDMGEIGKFLENFQFNHAMDSLWSYIADLDGLIDEQKPFQIVKEDKKKAQLQVTYLAKELGRIAKHLVPFMPATAEKIKTAIRKNKMPTPLFPRKD